MKAVNGYAIILYVVNVIYLDLKQAWLLTEKKIR